MSGDGQDLGVRGEKLGSAEIDTEILASPSFILTGYLTKFFVYIKNTFEEGKVYWVEVLAIGPLA
jgi:hypothetical protein